MAAPRFISSTPSLSHAPVDNVASIDHLLSHSHSTLPTHESPSIPLHHNQPEILESPSSNIMPENQLPIFPSTSISDQPEPPIPHSQPILQPSHSMVTRSKTNSLKLKTFPDYKIYYSTKHPLCALYSQAIPIEPSSFSQAVKFTEWQQVMQDEFTALKSNDTWHLCPRPHNRNVIKNKWVYKVKQKADGSVDRFKARLVAKGFQQQDGLDYSETFSPVIKPATIRVIIALAVHFGWPLRQLDVSNAFLHGTLEEEVFMEQPPGFIDSHHPTHVCKLKKSIYGLKQAPRAWFHRLSQSLVALGFTESRVDYSLFTFHTSHAHIFVLIYVDDIIVTGTHPSFILKLISYLKRDFAMKDLGPLHYFLGIKVSRDDQGVHLSQAKYIADVLHKAKMAGAKPCSTPLSSSTKLSQFHGDPLNDITTYRQIVVSLQYCVLTRPEIVFTVNQLCQFLHSPTTAHWSAVKRVLRYLKGTLHHGLYYGKGSLQLHAFSDSDWAGSVDDRRSTTRYAVFVGPCLVSWCAKKQPVVSKSSTESEY